MALCLILGCGVAASSWAQSESLWQKRCAPVKESPDAQQETEKCEIFQRLVVQETGKRLAEFAISPSPDGQGARGTMILPLGILIPEGVRMKIDDGPVMRFDLRYCDVIGCVGFVTLNDELLDMFRKGNEAQVVFKSPAGQVLGAKFALTGFTATYKQL